MYVCVPFNSTFLCNEPDVLKIEPFQLCATRLFDYFCDFNFNAGPVVSTRALSTATGELSHKFIQIKRRPLLENHRPKLIMRPAAVYHGVSHGICFRGPRRSHVRHTSDPHTTRITIFVYVILYIICNVI